jgi:hypothetical protein
VRALVKPAPRWYGLGPFRSLRERLQLGKDDLKKKLQQEASE